jgi:hypothetical protein
MAFILLVLHVFSQSSKVEAKAKDEGELTKEQLQKKVQDLTFELEQVWKKRVFFRHSSRLDKGYAFYRILLH